MKRLRRPLYLLFLVLYVANVASELQVATQMVVTVRGSYCVVDSYV